jgi:hypothetical protein
MSSRKVRPVTQNPAPWRRGPAGVGRAAGRETGRAMVTSAVCDRPIDQHKRIIPIVLIAIRDI